ncbi:hypothetical protein QBC45DRAFT_410462 [Copromyces sp. CBS 386.78]|nr:hypothetical protein QBC45DRAFT_410462 [Copromyces sp. CBS 386.78]
MLTVHTVVSRCPSLAHSGHLFGQGAGVRGRSKPRLQAQSHTPLPFEKIRIGTTMENSTKRRNGVASSVTKKCAFYNGFLFLHITKIIAQHSRSESAQRPGSQLRHQRLQQVSLSLLRPRSVTFTGRGQQPGLHGGTKHSTHTGRNRISISGGLAWRSRGPKVKVALDHTRRRKMERKTRRHELRPSCGLLSHSCEAPRRRQKVQTCLDAS